MPLFECVFTYVVCFHDFLFNTPVIHPSSVQSRLLAQHLQTSGGVSSDSANHCTSTFTEQTKSFPTCSKVACGSLDLYHISHFQIQKKNGHQDMTIMCYMQLQYISTISPFFSDTPRVVSRIIPPKKMVILQASPGKVPSAVVFAPSACAAARRRETPNPRPGPDGMFRHGWDFPCYCTPNLNKFIPKMTPYLKGDTCSKAHHF